MDRSAKTAQTGKSPPAAARMQAELDRKVFHLKTLYDVSQDIFTSVDSETILRNFLLMVMGNFGVVEGFILLADLPAGQITHFVNVGYRQSNVSLLKDGGLRFLQQKNRQPAAKHAATVDSPQLLPESVTFSLPFTVAPDCSGLLGLGPKLIGESFTGNDLELLDTLANNLAVALKNARSFEKITRLNLDLQAKNIALEEALAKLKASMRKVEILESVKANLSKFVPTTVTRLIEKSPNGEIPQTREQNVSVLFLDIENYTKICERLGDSQVGEIIEKHFSVFMDAIYDNNGDVNETAGDGLMVLFLDKDKEQNALGAVRTALKIREDTIKIGKECPALYRPLEINMGINSGTALVGATRFESYTGSRWTYTARGSVTNVAARIGSHATGGRLLLSKETAKRVKDHFTPSPLGKFNLKNVSEAVEIFEI